jgi:hypothetical protein
MKAKRSTIDPGVLGPQAETDEDLEYEGGRYADVRKAIFANPYQRIWGGANEPALPVYEVTLFSVLPHGGSNPFLDAARRTVDSRADLRWGPDCKGVRRLLHPNGVCLTGRWEITEETGYSGYFTRGSKGLVIGRYSTCCTETRRGHTRSLSLVGKVYPTVDPDHLDPLRPASFITQQDLGGEKTEHINDAELRNAPDTRAWRRGADLPVLLTTGAVFGRADKEPSIRQLYEIAELGKSGNEPTRCPEFMRLLVAPDPAQDRGRGARLSRRGPGTDLRPRRSRAEAHLDLPHRSIRRRHDQRYARLSTAHDQRLAPHREDRFRQWCGVLQWGFRDPLPPPDLARRPQ